MWYKIDVLRLALQLLPPILRSTLLTALLKVLVLPIVYIYEQFMQIKNNADERLRNTANVVSLERILNAAFHLSGRQIYIETAEVVNVVYMHLKDEQQKAKAVYKKEEGREYVIYAKGESVMGVNFIVYVPTFLCTSTENRADDKFDWTHLRVITGLLAIYKPAGRTFSIKLYDYE